MFSSSRSVELPASLVYEGYAGGYVGHVHPGRTEEVSIPKVEDLSSSSS